MRTTLSGCKAAPRSSAAKLVGALGGRFSSELGIDAASRDPKDLFKWFLAAMLFGGRISGNLARRTYREFAKQGLLSPESLLRRGWNGLVEVLDKGGYVRYDFKTATKLLDMSKALLERYAGDLNQLHTEATDSEDLEKKLKALAKGIGGITINIFLREIRGVWLKAEPMPTDLALSAARDLGLLRARLRDRGRALEVLKKVWLSEGNRIEDFCDFEAALVRHGLVLRRSAARTPTPSKRRMPGAAPRGRV